MSGLASCPRRRRDGQEREKTAAFRFGAYPLQVLPRPLPRRGKKVDQLRRVEGGPPSDGHDQAAGGLLKKTQRRLQSLDIGIRRHHPEVPYDHPIQQGGKEIGSAACLP